MKHSVLACLALAGTCLAQSPQSTQSCVEEPRSLYESLVDLAQPEMPRIQEHLADVLERLRARDDSDLSPTQRAERERQIERLAKYRERGIFPQNHALPGITPIFVDDGGRACAVAHLMIESGARDVAEAVAATQNYAYVGQITASGVAEWTERSGLSAEECAMIQPGYCGFGFQDLECSSSGYDVFLDWGTPFGYPTNIYRDGILIVTLSGTLTTYVDVGVPPGVYSYAVYDEHIYCDACSIDHQAPNYCTAAPNSIGSAGVVMLMSGSSSIAANDLVVRTTGVGIPNGFAQFYYGPDQVQIPFGHGFRCVGGSIKRLTPFVQANASGRYSLRVDNTQSPMAADWSPGSTWNFQLWYRDPMAGPPNFNLSDGLSILFAP